jgi:hypothetical protein
MNNHSFTLVAVAALARTRKNNEIVTVASPPPPQMVEFVNGHCLLKLCVIYVFPFYRREEYRKRSMAEAFNTDPSSMSAIVQVFFTVFLHL